MIRSIFALFPFRGWLNKCALFDNISVLASMPRQKVDERGVVNGDGREMYSCNKTGGNRIVRGEVDESVDTGVSHCPSVVDGRSAAVDHRGEGVGDNTGAIGTSGVLEHTSIIGSTSVNGTVRIRAKSGTRANNGIARANCGGTSGLRNSTGVLGRVIAVSRSNDGGNIGRACVGAAGTSIIDRVNVETFRGIGDIDGDGVVHGGDVVGGDGVVDSDGVVDRHVVAGGAGVVETNGDIVDHGAVPDNAGADRGGVDDNRYPRVDGDNGRKQKTVDSYINALVGEILDGANRDSVGFFVQPKTTRSRSRTVQPAGSNGKRGNAAGTGRARSNREDRSSKNSDGGKIDNIDNSAAVVGNNNNNNSNNNNNNGGSNEALSRALDMISNADPRQFMGHDKHRLTQDRATKARLSSPMCTFEPLSVVSALVQRFRSRVKNVNEATVANYLRFVAKYRLRAAGATSHGSLLSVGDLAEQLRLFDLYDRFREIGRHVVFEPNEHLYRIYLPEKREFITIDRSVTRSLELIFGSFNADIVAQRMVNSQKWKNNAFYYELNFDEAGNTRDKSDVIRLLKSKWEAKRNRGTALHGYIQSLTENEGTNITAETIEPMCVTSPDDETDEAGTAKRKAATDMSESNETPVPTKRVRATETTESAESNESSDPIDSADPTGRSDSTGSSDSCELDRPITDLSSRPSRDAARDQVGDGDSLLEISRQLRDDLERRFDNYLYRVHVNDRRKRPGGEKPPPSSSSSVESSGTNNDIDVENVTAFERFNQQRFDNGWLLLATEFIVYDLDVSLAGSIDAVYVPYPHRPELLVLVDWKRCDIDLGTRYSPVVPGMRHHNNYTSHYPKCNYWKYAMQLNVYRELLERMLKGRAIVIDMLIVSFPEHTSFPRVHSVPRMNDAQLFVDELKANNAISSDALESGNPSS